MKKHILLTFFAMLLLWLSSAAQNYERASLWQKEIDAFAEIDRRQTPPPNAVLFVGSSSVRKWDSLRQDFPSANVVNRGFGGSHLEDVNFYFDRIVAPYKAKKIFLYAGENDLTAGKTPERVLEDFRKFAALARAKSPASKLYFISLKPSPSRWHLREKFRQLNDSIETEIKSIKNAAFIDVWTPMLGADGEPPPEYFIADRLHMNQKGYNVWRAVLAKYLK
jgi:lysophospholipase L1-like esterase